MATAIETRMSDEKDYHTEHLSSDIDSAEALRKIRTAGGISISPELFEKLYLSPQNKVKGELRQTFANPTPVAVVGFLIALTPLSCDLMGWRGNDGTGLSGIGNYYFFGGMLMTFGSIGEWIIGNTFPFVVFASFGAFWLAFAATLQPAYNAYGAYSETNIPSDGLTSAGFNSTFGFFMLAMAFLCFIYLICALRTNVVFVLIFFGLMMTFALLCGAHWEVASGHVVAAANLQIAGGAFGFFSIACGWWIFAAILLASLDFPFQIPVGDLSNFIKPMSAKKKVSEV